MTPLKLQTGARVSFGLCLCLLGFCMIGLVLQSGIPTLSNFKYGAENQARLPDKPDASITSTEGDRGSSSRQLLKPGESTDDFRDLLLPDVRYIIGGYSKGLTNQLIALINHVYLGQLTRRVPILPALSPYMLLPFPELAAWSDFFDLERLQQTSGIPLLEIGGLTSALNRTKSHRQSITCWSSREVLRGAGHHQGALSLGHHNIRYRHFPLPTHITPIVSKKNAPRNPRIGSKTLASFDLSYDKTGWIQAVSSNSSFRGRQKPASDVKPPEEQLLCFDDLYYITEAVPDNSAFADLPVFGQYKESFVQVGQFLHFTQAIQDLATAIIARLLGETKFLAIHIRRGDFGTKRWTFDHYANKLQELRDELSTARPGQVQSMLPEAHSLPVFVLSDDNSSNFYRELDMRGWRYYDHTVAQTTDRYGPWHAAILDSAFLSMAHGMVGTPHSTFSLFAMLRIHAWQGMPSKFLEDQVDL